MVPESRKKEECLLKKREGGRVRDQGGGTRRPRYGRMNGVGQFVEKSSTFWENSWPQKVRGSRGKVRGSGERVKGRHCASRLGRGFIGWGG